VAEGRGGDVYLTSLGAAQSHTDDLPNVCVGGCACVLSLCRSLRKLLQ